MPEKKSNVLHVNFMLGSIVIMFKLCCVVGVREQGIYFHLILLESDSRTVSPSPSPLPPSYCDVRARSEPAPPTAARRENFLSSVFVLGVNEEKPPITPALIQTNTRPSSHLYI